MLTMYKLSLSYRVCKEAEVAGDLSIPVNHYYKGICVWM